MIRSVFMRVTAGVAVSLPEMSEKWSNLNVLYYVGTYFVLQTYYCNVYYYMLTSHVDMIYFYTYSFYKFNIFFAKCYIIKNM